MLTIRRPQLEALRNCHLSVFNDRVVEHLRRCFPKRCAALTSEELSGMVGTSLARADRAALKPSATCAVGSISG